MESELAFFFCSVKRLTRRSGPLVDTISCASNVKTNQCLELVWMNKILCPSFARLINSHQLKDNYSLISPTPNKPKPNPQLHHTNHTYCTFLPYYTIYPYRYMYMHIKVCRVDPAAVWPGCLYAVGMGRSEKKNKKNFLTRVGRSMNVIARAANGSLTPFCLGGWGEIALFFLYYAFYGRFVLFCCVLFCFFFLTWLRKRKTTTRKRQAGILQKHSSSVERTLSHARSPGWARKKPISCY